MSKSTKHPAKFTDDILDAVAELLPDRDLAILDPFAGVGRVHGLRERGKARGFVWYTEGVELEYEWARQSNGLFGAPVMVGSTLRLSRALDTFYPSYNAIVTSPCYGNRMADTYAGDGTDRHTYRIYLGRELSEGSSAGLQWGERYRIFHRRAWAEVTRECKRDAVFILNIKDHIRKGKVAPVTRFHVRTLRQLGWRETGRIEVGAPGHRHGENYEARVEYESVIRFELAEWF